MPETPKVEVLHFLKPAAQTVLQSLWKVPKWPSSRSSSLPQDLGYMVISICILVQKACAVLLWITVKLRKGMGLKSPGKTQMQQDRILQESPSHDHSGSISFLVSPGRMASFLAINSTAACLLLPSHCCLSNHMAKIPCYRQHASSLTTIPCMAKSTSGCRT